MQNPRKRLSKEKIKEDEVISAFFKAWGWVEENYPRLLAGLGAVIAIVLVVAFVNDGNKRKSLEALDVLGEAQIALFEGNTAEALLKAEKVANDYEGENAAGQALLLLGNVQYEMDRHVEAQVTFQRYLDGFGSEGPGGFSAWTGIASCLEIQGNSIEACSKYAAYADGNATASFASLALKESGRCYLSAGDTEKAKAQFKRILDEYSSASAARFAKAELNKLGVDLQ